MSNLAGQDQGALLGDDKPFTAISRPSCFWAKLLV